MVFNWKSELLIAYFDHSTITACKCRHFGQNQVQYCISSLQRWCFFQHMGRISRMDDDACAGALKPLALHHDASMAARTAAQQ